MAKVIKGSQASSFSAVKQWERVSFPHTDVGNAIRHIVQYLVDSKAAEPPKSQNEDDLRRTITELVEEASVLAQERDGAIKHQGVLQDTIESLSEKNGALTQERNFANKDLKRIMGQRDDLADAAEVALNKQADLTKELRRTNKELERTKRQRNTLAAKVKELGARVDLDKRPLGQPVGGWHHPNDITIRRGTTTWAILMLFHGGKVRGKSWTQDHWVKYVAETAHYENQHGCKLLPETLHRLFSTEGVEWEEFGEEDDEDEGINLRGYDDGEEDDEG